MKWFISGRKSACFRNFENLAQLVAGQEKGQSPADKAKVPEGLAVGEYNQASIVGELQGSQGGELESPQL